MLANMQQYIYLRLLMFFLVSEEMRNHHWKIVLLVICHQSVQISKPVAVGTKYLRMGQVKFV